MIERYVTLACVSNEVGGDLIGNARWLGVPIKDLLDEAEPEDGADQVVEPLGRRLHRRHARPRCCATAATRCSRSAMNGEPLPVEHGFPVRMVVPGLYGYVSATQVARRAGADHVRRLRRVLDAARLGGSRRRSRRSRASTRPRPAQRLPAGPVVVAGVAWAQHRGISRVEVRVDGGAVAGGDAGRDGVGRHLAAVVLALGRHPGRAHRSRCGRPTTPARCRPSARRRRRPDGATGWHSDRRHRRADVTAVEPGRCRAGRVVSRPRRRPGRRPGRCVAPAPVGGRRRAPSRASSRATSTRPRTRSARSSQPAASSRSRSASVKPPQTPYGSRAASAWAAHSARTDRAGALADGLGGGCSRRRRRDEPRSPSGWKNCQSDCRRPAAVRTLTSLPVPDVGGRASGQPAHVRHGFASRADRRRTRAERTRTSPRTEQTNSGKVRNESASAWFPFVGEREVTVRSVLVCVRTPLAAQAVANAAARLGLGDVIADRGQRRRGDGPAGRAPGRRGARRHRAQSGRTPSASPGGCWPRARTPSWCSSGRRTRGRRGGGRGRRPGLIRGGDHEDLRSAVAKALLLLAAGGRGRSDAAVAPRPRRATAGALAARPSRAAADAERRGRPPAGGARPTAPAPAGPPARRRSGRPTAGRRPRRRRRRRPAPASRRRGGRRSP